MPFIAKADLAPYITQDDLDTVSQGDDTYIDDAIKVAEAEAKNYLRVRYDVDTIFAETGNDRDPVVKEKVIDIAIFKLHKALPTNQVPEKRVFLYESALDWLEKAAKGGVLDLDLSVETDEDGDEVRPNIRFGKIKNNSTYGSY